MIVDYTQLDRWIVLRLEREGDKWVAVDADLGVVYMRHENPIEVGRWMRRMYVTEPFVEIDEWSVSEAYSTVYDETRERAAWLRAQQSLGGEPEAATTRDAPLSPAVAPANSEPASPPRYVWTNDPLLNELLADIRGNHSVKVRDWPDNVIPLPLKGDAA